MKIYLDRTLFDTAASSRLIWTQLATIFGVDGEAECARQTEF